MIEPSDIQIILGKGRPLSRPHTEAHPQVLIIARDIAHLRWLANHLPEDLLDAIIINTGPNAYRRPDGIGVVPLALLGP